LQGYLKRWKMPFNKEKGLYLQIKPVNVKDFFHRVRVIC